MANYIRFDWAMKRMLRDKANHAVLERLMTALLGEKFTIVKFPATGLSVEEIESL